MNTIHCHWLLLCSGPLTAVTSLKAYITQYINIKEAEKSNKDVSEFKRLYVEKEGVCKLIKFKLEYVEKGNMFPNYILSASDLNTHSVNFMVCIFNRDLFCELNLAGVFSGICLSSINNGSSILVVLFFPYVGPVKQCDQ